MSTAALSIVSVSGCWKKLGDHGEHDDRKL